MKDILQDYLKLLDEVYNRPPRNVSTLALNMMLKYPTKLVCHHVGKEMAGGLMVHTLGNGIYGIGGVAIIEKFRKQGFAKYLVNLAHCQCEGVFFIRTRIPKFFEKVGYKTILETENKHYMVYTNSEVFFSF